MELWKYAVHCKFPATQLEDALHDQLVCGLRNDQMQKRLLTELDLTLEKALQIAQGMEAADYSTKALKEPVTVAPVKVYSQTKPWCYRCGKTDHNEKDCKF